MKVLGILLVLLASISFVDGFDYMIDEEEGDLSLYLIDVKTGIDNDGKGLQSLFRGKEVNVDVTGIAWTASENSTGNSNLTYTTYLDGVEVGSGVYDLAVDGKLLPHTIPNVGVIKPESNGRVTVTVELLLDGVTTVIEGEYEVFAAGAAIVPLIIILVFAAGTQLVELSLIMGIFVGACMVAGNIKDGFFATLDTYILQALANEGHAFVYLFTFFLSGTVGMMEKSGGFGGFTTSMSYFAKTAMSGQLTAYISGLAIFFDDYANTLIVGESMRPLSDLLSVSREKLAFIVDATSAPVASIVPISAWIGYEVGLIQDELDKIFARLEPGEEAQISNNALDAFLKSVKYRYYPIFMLLLLPTLILARRDYGPMLVAERKTQVFARQDGGDGRASVEAIGEKANQPERDTPKRVWNMLVPLAVLVILIIYLLIESGEDPTVSQTVIDKLQKADSYAALLYGSMATALLTMLWYHLQFKQDGTELLWPTPRVIKEYVVGLFKKEDDEIPRVRPIMSIRESVMSFLFGMGHVFPAAIVLTLAWASGSIMQAVGTDRLFAELISDSIPPEAMPTISFIISFLMALATGTSWGTMAIMFPLLTVPTYDASNGNAVIFYATIAGILSGSVAGDHVSPISDTTVLSCLATDCNLLRHVVTQSPYVFWMCIVSVLLGTLPVGYDAYPSGVAFLLGYIFILGFTFLLCRKIINKDGFFDPLTEFFLRFRPDSELHELKHATAQAYESMIVRDATEKPAARRSTVAMMSSFFFFKKNEPSEYDMGVDSTKKEVEVLAAVNDDEDDDDIYIAENEPEHGPDPEHGMHKEEEDAEA